MTSASTKAPAAVRATSLGSIKVEKLACAIGAELSNVNLGVASREPELVAEIKSLLLAHKVVFFRDQDITQAEHVAFARHFGELEDHPVLGSDPDHPGLVRIYKSPDTPVERYENAWHTDATWREKPPMGSVLRCVACPPVGGDTMWANMAEAYARLPEHIKTQIAGLRARHSIEASFGAAMPIEKRHALKAQFPDAEHPVVRTHPETGEKVLFVNAYTTHFSNFHTPANVRFGQDANLRADVYDHLLSLSPGYFTRVSTGEVLSRLTVDAAMVENLVGSTASIATRATITLIGASVMLAITNAQLSGLLLLIIPAMLGPVLLFGRRVRTLASAAQDRIADASSAASESIDAIDTVQAFGREDDMRARFRTAVEKAFEAARQRIGARAQLTAGAISVMFLGVALVLWLGARSVLTGDMTPGALAQFVLFAILAASNGAMLSEVWGDVLKASGATERLTQILAEAPDIRAPLSPIALPEPGRGLVQFDGVSFSYPGAGERSALRDFSLTVKHGETVALVGPSGAGKSTVFRLLLRFYDPQAGRLLLDGVEARDGDPRAWRTRFSYVSQDAHLFSGTAGENIAVGRPDASAVTLEAAARRAEAWAFLEPRGGLGALVGDRGKALSGGERQRLALARALARDAPVLLLDEATSALDAQNERYVQSALAEARKGRTTLVIAHRLATVLEADRIVVMDAGRVVEEGDHAALVARGGLYARLAAMQFMEPSPLRAG